jgi:hypothetical protein
VLLYQLRTILKLMGLQNVTTGLLYIIKSPILSPEPNGSSTLKDQWSHGHANTAHYTAKVSWGH